MLCTVQCRPASACARKSPPRGCTLKKQDKTRQGSIIVVCTGLLASINESRELTRTHSLLCHPATWNFQSQGQKKSGQHTKHATASPWQHSHSQARPSQPCGRWPCLVVRRGGKPRAPFLLFLRTPTFQNPFHDVLAQFCLLLFFYLHILFLFYKHCKRSLSLKEGYLCAASSLLPPRDS